MRLIIQGKGYSRVEAAKLWQPGDGWWTLNEAVDRRSTAHFEMHVGVERYPEMVGDCVLYVHPDAEVLRVKNAEPVPVHWLTCRYCPKVNGVPVPKYGNTVCYMLAMVARWNDRLMDCRPITEVHMPGVDLLADRRERVVELENVMYWMGVLQGMGVQVHVSANSAMGERWSYPN